MFQLPLIASNNILAPTQTVATTTATLASIPTTYLVNAVTPCIVYDTKFVSSVLATDIPINGFFINNPALFASTQNEAKTTTTCDQQQQENEKKIDDLIEEKVCEQFEKINIDKQNDEKVVEKEEKKEIEKVEEVTKNESTNCEHACYSCCCCCCCPYEKHKEEAKKEEIIETKDSVDTTRYYLSLDEKIKKIREELNLPLEKDDDRLCDQLKKNHHISRSSSANEKRSHSSLTSKYHINCIKPREQTTQEGSTISYIIERSRSRSRSHSRPRSAAKSPTSRPPWVPTGRNIYNRTHFDFFPDAIQPKSTTTQTQTDSSKSTQTNNHSNNYEYYYVKDPGYYYNYYETKPTSSLYTMTTAVPAKTTIKTTISLGNKTNMPSSNVLYTTNSTNSNALYTTNSNSKSTYLPPILKNSTSRNYILSRPTSASANYSYETSKSYPSNTVQYRPVQAQAYYHNDNSTNIINQIKK